MIDQHRTESRGVEVLVAEDSVTQALSLQYLLEQEGYRVTVCENGRKALESARQRKPTLVISDIVMPELDGYGLCRALKSDPDLADVPLLLVTTLNDPEDVLRGLEAGADSFILKPYDDPFLLNRIRFVLLHRQLRQTDRTDMGVEISFKGRTHFITSDRLQILNLLLSTYEAAIHRNDELRRSEDELRKTNAALSEANARLEKEVLHRQRVEEQVRKLSQDLLEASEAQLQHSEARFRQLLDVVPAAIYATDADGRILEYNPAAAAMWDTRPQPGIYSKDFYAGFVLQHPDGTPLGETQCQMGITLGDGTPVRNAGLVLQRADGSRVEALVNTAAIHTADGQPAGAINCLLDVTEVAQAQRESTVSRLLAQSTLDALSPRITVLDEAGTVMAVNAAWRKFWADQGMQSGESPANVDDLMTDLQSIGCGEEEIECFASGLRDVATGLREQFSMECDSESLQRALLVRIKRFAFGGTTRTLVLQEDITERKLAEAKIRENSALLRIAGEMARIGGWACLVAEQRVILSDETAVLHELPSGTSLSVEEAFAHYTPESQELLKEQFAACVERGQPIDAEAQFISAKGRRMWVRVIAEAVGDADGVVARVQGAVQDITARRQQEEQLARTAERLTTTLESITDGFFTVDREWHFTYVNREGERILQRTRNQMLGQRVWDVFPDAVGTEFERQYHIAVEEHRATQFETYYPALDLWVDVHAYPSEEGLAVYFRDVTKRKQAELALRQSEENLRLAVTAGGLGTWHWNSATGEVQVSNESKALFGIALDSPMTHADFLAGVHPEDRAMIAASLKASVEEGTEFRTDFRVLLPDGSVRWLASLGRAYPDEERGGMRVEGVNLDITERKRSERELLELNDQLEQRVDLRTRELAEATRQAEAANQAKSVFLATMSHEIRTPMNGIVGMVDVLAHGALTEHQADAVNTIRDSAFALLNLIDDVLDFSKIEAGKLELERTPVVLSDVAEGVCDTLGPLADSNGAHVFLFVTPLGPAQVWSDPVRLRQILYNLIGNAIKFSGGHPTRRGRVELRIEIASERPFRVRIRVADNGIGMSAEVQRNLFQSFRQAEISTTRRFGGSGLGLAICRRLVDLAGGTISVESEVGQGTIMTVELPLEPVEGSGAAFQPTLDGIDYVVVAGPYVNASDLKVYLECAGARVQVVGSGQEAIRTCTSMVEPVVVHGVLDDGMRAEWLSFFAHLPGVRHLLISRGRRRVARLAGSNVVTIDGNSLRRRALLHAAAVAAGRASPAQRPSLVDSPLAPAVAPTMADARARGQLILVAEDDTTNQKVLLRQLELLGYAAEVAVDGAEALKLWRKGGYGLVITDLHMPNLDGYGLTAAIRREEGKTRMPVFALTANALRGEAKRAAAVGLDEYLTKPLQLQQLRDVLEKWLPPACASRSDSVPATEPNRREASILDLDVLRQLIGDAPATAAEMLVDYGQSLDMAVEALQDAVRSDAISEVGRIAHRLKSSSRAVGALPFGDLCAELENASRMADRVAVAHLVTTFETAAKALLSEVRRHTGEEA